MTPGLLLAVVLGAGRVPITEATMKFPDSSSWSGAGQRRVENMLADVRSAQETRLAAVGPGPQQLAARWQRGQLNAAERVAVLLGASVFHHPAVLPIYADGLRSRVLRERQAAMVGLAWFLGVPPPDPEQAAEGSAVLGAARRSADALVLLLRERTLADLWCESYLVARGLVPTEGRVLLHPDAKTCLLALREIAGPQDLDSLTALWPAVAERDRPALLRTLEAVTMQQFFIPPANPQAPTGGWLYVDAAARVDAWVGGLCRSVEGFGLALANMARAWPLPEPPERPYQPLLTPMEGSYEPLWFLPSELLVAFGGRSVSYDRVQTDNPRNRDQRDRVRDSFPISKGELRDVRNAETPHDAAPPRRPTRRP